VSIRSPFVLRQMLRSMNIGWVLSVMAILQQLGNHGTANAGHFFPVAINLLSQMEAPTPAQATAGITGINDGPSLFLIEAY
jgi:hypothetical protein